MDRYAMLDRALAAIDELKADTIAKTKLVEAQSKEVKALTADTIAKTKLVEAQSRDIQKLNQTVDSLMVTVSKQQLQIDSLIKDNMLLMESNRVLVQENQALKQRMDTLEARLDLLDLQLANIAPLVRHLLEAQNSVLLSPDYQEIRDNIDTIEFTSTSELIIIQGLNQSRYTSLHGMSSALGRSIVGFYQIVLGFKPRKIKGKAGFWLIEETPVINPAILLAKSLNVA